MNPVRYEVNAHGAPISIPKKESVQPKRNILSLLSL